MIRRRYVAVACLITGTVLACAVPSKAHVILDGEIVQPILLDITKYLREAKDGRTEDARLEALYLVAEKTEHLVELMNLDLMAHGKSLYAELVAKRLHEYGIRIRRVERTQRYVYDQAAFHEYLKRSPRGKRAPDASFRLISQAFYGSVGTDVAELVDMDVDGLRWAIRQKETFLRDYPGYEKVKEVRFFLAMDYYRLHSNSRDPATAKKYEKVAAEALQAIVKEYPGTAEARAAEITLEKLQRADQKN